MGAVGPVVQALGAVGPKVHGVSPADLGAGAV